MYGLDNLVEAGVHLVPYTRPFPEAAVASAVTPSGVGLPENQWSRSPIRTGGNAMEARTNGG